MIRLIKGTIPPILAQNAEAWTRELLEHLNRGDNPPEGLWSRYKRPEIKLAICNECRDKCMYCESKILHVAHGDIEHIRPKSRFPDQTFRWENLGLVCARCNGAKANQYDEAVPPVNPYQDDPEAFFVALGPIIWFQAGSDRGQVTETLVKLNRPELLERRRERLAVIHRLIDSLVRAPSDAVRDVLRGQLCLELMSDREYVFVSRAAATALGFAWEECPGIN